MEAVIVCSNYSDFLSHSMPLNKIHFERLVVVTSPEDKATRKLCEYHHVKTVVTDKMETHWGRFRKSIGINEGLAELNKDGWMMHMDADIVLPPLFRKIFDGLDLDTTHLYGMDRFMVPNFKRWLKHISDPKLQQENETWLHTDAFETGVRVMREHQYVPIGFAQIWHADSGVFEYPTKGNGAGRDDMLFAEKWPRKKRSMIPELLCYHLESEKANMGANWNGRATKQFAPEDDKETYE